MIFYIRCVFLSVYCTVSHIISMYMTTKWLHELFHSYSMLGLSYYSICPKIVYSNLWAKMTYASSADIDQTAPSVLHCLQISLELCQRDAQKNWAKNFGHLPYH